MKTFHHSILLSGLVLMAAVAGCSHTAPEPSPTRRPNILFIMSDDHAIEAVGAYGSNRNRTPNMDRLAAEGMRLENCFAVNSICGPSRAAILTGKYGHMNGFRRNMLRFDTGQQTFQRLIQESGYQTALVGKWHLSVNDAQNPPPGFDYWNILPGQGKYYNPDMFEMGEERQYPGYTTDIITDLSLSFLEKRDKDRPFLLMVHHKAPHSPWEYAERHAAMFDGTDIPEPATLWDDYTNRSKATREGPRSKLATLQKSMESPDWPTGQLLTSGLDQKTAKSKTYQKFLKDYLRSVAGVDDSIGRFLEYLEEEGIVDDTIVIYTSDQGFFLGEHGWHNKRFVYEESIRMPFLIRYPDVVEPGAVNQQMILNIDFAETLLDLAGLPVPGDMQGRSFRPLLEGEEVSDWRSSMFYRYYQGDGVPLHYGVRTERHKLIYFTDTDEWELFDLDKDPNELNSVYSDPEYAGVVAELKTELERLCRQLQVTDQDLNQFVRIPPDR